VNTPYYYNKYNKSCNMCIIWFCI